jgi:hypothetical protein
MPVSSMYKLSGTSIPPLLKRVRSESEEYVKQTLKACKINFNSSPTSSLKAKRLQRNEPVHKDQREWPVIKGCNHVRYTIMFLQNSRQHAMGLLKLNHWSRAIGVLEKVEKATERVSTQRRQVVLEQANSTRQRNGPYTKKEKITVRFNDQIQVTDAVEVDRSAHKIETPVRAEMLILRAIRSIPNENYSEFWN